MCRHGRLCVSLCIVDSFSQIIYLLSKAQKQQRIVSTNEFYVNILQSYFHIYVSEKVLLFTFGGDM